MRINVRQAGCPMRWRLSLLVIVAVVLKPSGGRSAEPASLLRDFTLRRWTSDDGLPERVVQGVTQDDDGYLWVTTFRHVLRFDGVRFVPCGGIGGEIEGNGAEIAVQVLATRGRRLWLRTTEAVWLRDATGWRPVLRERPDPDNFASLREIPDGSGDVLVTTATRVVRLGGRGPASDSPQPPESLLPWMIFRGEPLEPQGTSLVVRPVAAGASGPRVWDVGRWRGDTVGLTSSGLAVWRNKRWQTLAETPASTGKMLCDPTHDGIWCGGDSGLWLVRQPDSSPQWLGLVNGRSPVNVTVRGLFADRGGNIWVGTDAGLVRLRRREAGFTLATADGRQPGINAAWVESSGRVWAASDEGGLVQGVAASSQAEPPTFSRVTLDEQVDRLRFETVQRSADGTLWLGTDGAYLWKCLDGRPAQRVVYRGLGRRMAIVTALAPRDAGGLWVGSGDGLFMLGADGEIIAPEDPANRVIPVSAIVRDEDGSIWCATIGGGVVHRDASGAVKGVLDRSAGLPSDVVHAVHRDRQGALWLGTEAGLARAVEESGRLRGVPVSPGGGMRNTAVVQIEEDLRGRLWLGTREGIVVVRRPTSEVGGLGAVSRLDAGGPLADVACRGRVGREQSLPGERPLVFPSEKGLVIVEPACDPPAAQPPTVLIEEISHAGGRAADDDQRVIASPAGMNRVALAAGASDIDLHFTALHFSAADRPVFRYRLRAPSSHRLAAAAPWISVGHDRSVTFRALPAGRHLFEVTAGVDGAWQEQPASLVLDVAPFIWQRPLFLLASAAGGAVTAAAAVAAALRQRYRRQLAREQAVQRERERIARDIHDDLGAGLTQVALLSDIAADDLGDKAEMERHLARIFKTSRELAVSLDEIVWAVNPGNDSLEKLVSFVGEFTQDFLASAQVRCRLDLPADVPHLKVGAAVRHHLCMVLKEALNNAVRHSGAREVTVGVELRGRRLRLSIQDDGRGVESAATRVDPAGRQSGLADMERRMNEVRGVLQVVATAPGTRVMAEVGI